MSKVGVDAVNTIVEEAMGADNSQDRRRHERKQLKTESGGVVFLARIGEDMVDIESVHDVSISGIRLGISRSMKIGQNVELVAKESDFSVSVIGTIRWTAPQPEDGSHVYGIEFDRKDMDNNILFFMSLRKYIDGFDDVPLKEM